MNLRRAAGSCSRSQSAPEPPLPVPVACGGPGRRRTGTWVQRGRPRRGGRAPYDRINDSNSLLWDAQVSCQVRGGGLRDRDDQVRCPKLAQKRLVHQAVMRPPGGPKVGLEQRDQVIGCSDESHSAGPPRTMRVGRVKDGSPRLAGGAAQSPRAKEPAEIERSEGQRSGLDTSRSERSERLPGSPTAQTRSRCSGGHSSIARTTPRT